MSKEETMAKQGSAQARMVDLAMERGFGLSTDGTSRAFVLRVEAPHGQHFDGEIHERVFDNYEQPRDAWAEAERTLRTEATEPCGPDCEWWG